ncbi:calcium-binding protein [Sulfitobacter donghicola]|uniref:Hemolysin expression modulating protein n=1 Tax=Sulfitobacter donghicola DSW-25 = KCTC 12864 = JCM 14565 TaxID=1300350 RepID=A0A073IL76_9RHOB|nr:calcium-binding protein [Sulfitobacter donghicola]KEJ90345.1 hemolysin expression modulating protein [Sulfitobacter donghicola DSW-25 = KCTC 12864 = JCM 14565]KIN67571.1 Hemolysin-type calcium-binding protein [Sulfitobacter donghicola DSW-25 = KCTC 12864 = JCM 14565]
MAIITEGIDAAINAGASGNYGLLEGDTFNGNLGGSDTEDGINLSGLTIGQTYKVSVTVDDIAGFNALTLINHTNFHSITHHVTDGISHEVDGGAGWIRDFVTASTISIDGNTLSFEFTPLQHTSLAFQIQSNAAAEAYSVSFAPAIIENIIDGTAGNDKTNGEDGVDIMSGLAGNDQLDGKAGDDVLDGGDGKDKLTGGLGDDTAIGGDGNDLLEGGSGNDLLQGGSRNDRLHGGDDDDILEGGNGNDKLYGDAGDDALTGGFGKDVMSGGAGADTFHFESRSHRDTITDFENGADMLDFSAHASINSIADLSIAQNGSNTVISYGGPDSVTLLNTDMALIEETDFIF